MIITISGKARHGKDTCADILKQLYESDGKRVAIASYGSHIKQMYVNYFNWNGEKTTEAREFLQWLGTDRIRKINPDFHVNRTIEDMEILKDSFDIFIIPDTRFPNELIGDYNIKVVRLNYESELTEKQQQHESETALNHYNNFDLIISANSGDFTSLRRQLIAFKEVYG